MKKFKDFKLNENSSNDIYVVFKISNGWETSVLSFWSMDMAEQYYIDCINNYYRTEYDNYLDALTHHDENYNGYQIYLEKSQIN